MRASALLPAVLISQAFAVSTARMALPPEFPANATRIEIDGFGGRNKGSYRLVDPDGKVYSGAFTRGESRLGVFDPLLVKNKGKGSFDFTDQESAGTLSATCEMKKVSVTVDIVTFDPKKVAYDCAFRADDVLQSARLVIGQPRRSGLKQQFLARDLRSGESAMFGQHLRIESVHHYQGTTFSSQAPVGYLLHSGDTSIAAVELTDVNPGIYLPPGLDDGMKRTVLITALAIAVFRDPALSALEDD